MLLELLLLILLVYFIYVKYLKEKERSNYPPGPSKLPVIGNLHQLIREIRKKRPIYEVLNDISKKYGSISSIKIGLNYQLIVNDYEIAKEIFASENWTDRLYDDGILKKHFGLMFGFGILFVSGDPWREMRRFTIRTLRDFGFGKQKSMETSIEEELSDLISRLNSKIDEKNGTKAVIPVRGLFTVPVLNLIWRLIAGIRFAADDEKLEEFTQLIKDMSKNFNGGNIFVFLPFLVFLEPYSAKGKFRKKFYTTLHGYFSEIINERRSLGTYKDVQNDFFDVYLKEIDDKSGEPGNLYTESRLINLAFDLFGAGSDTTANTLEFAVLYMILNPKIQEKVRQEIQNVVGNSRFPSTLDRPNMPYVEAVILEIQRFANVVPLIIRAANCDTTLGGFDLPKKSAASINLHAIHMNKETFGDPQVFRPERFLEKTENGLKVVNGHKILPFGFGRRICVGESLAKSSLFVIFTSLIQRFTFEIPKGEKLPSIEPIAAFTQSPQDFNVEIKLV